MEKLSHIIHLLRIHQWGKNVLLFVALLCSHKFQEGTLWLDTLLAFISLSLLASSLYIFNDLRDIKHDRGHPTKKHRPLAKGTLSTTTASSVSITLLVCAFGISLTQERLPQALIFYLVLSVSYTLYLKKLFLIDLYTLSLFYLYRVIAGGWLNNLPISPWLLGFAFFMFIGLALLKRFVEVQQLGNNRVLAAGRPYGRKDLTMLYVHGISSGYLALLFLAFYIQSPTANSLYNHVDYLWSGVILFSYWHIRLWSLAQSKQVHDDPVVFVFKDKLTYFLIPILAIIFYLAW